MTQKSTLPCPFSLNSLFKDIRSTSSASSSSSSSTNVKSTEKKITPQQRLEQKLQGKKQEEETSIELISDSTDIIPFDYWHTNHLFHCYYCKFPINCTSVPRPQSYRQINGKYHWNIETIEFHHMCLRLWQSENEKMLTEGELVLTTIFFRQVYGLDVKKQQLFLEQVKKFIQIYPIYRLSDRYVYSMDKLKPIAPEWWITQVNNSYWNNMSIPNSNQHVFVPCPRWIIIRQGVIPKPTFILSSVTAGKTELTVQEAKISKFSKPSFLCPNEEEKKGPLSSITKMAEEDQFAALLN